MKMIIVQFDEFGKVVDRRQYIDDKENIAPNRGVESIRDQIPQMDYAKAEAKYLKYFRLYSKHGSKAADKGKRLLKTARMLSNQMFSLSGNDAEKQERKKAMKEASDFIKHGAPAKGNATPHDASTPQAQPATVDDDSPTNAGNSEDPILEFEDNEHNHQVLDELFDLLLEVPEMTVAGTQEVNIDMHASLQTPEIAEVDLVESILTAEEDRISEWDAEIFDFSYFI